MSSHQYIWFASGSNADGLLQRRHDLSSREDAAGPVHADLPQNASRLVLGPRHALALINNGSGSGPALLTFGANDVGQCGLPPSCNYAEQRELQVLGGALQGSAAEEEGQGGEVGLGEGPASSASPSVLHAAVGWQHSVVAMDSGAVYAFGGLFSSDISSSGGGVHSPVRFPVPAHTRVVSVACTQESAFVAGGEGRVYGWGSPKHGLLPGLPPETAHIGHVSTPLLLALQPHAHAPGPGPGPGTGQVEADLRVTKLAAGWQHVVALTSDGNIISWGSNKWGQCGRVATEPTGSAAGASGSAGVKAGQGARAHRSILPPGWVDLPSSIEGGRFLHVQDIYSCWHSMAAIARVEHAPGHGAEQESGDVMLLTWGRADMGQLGRPVAGQPPCRLDAVPAPVRLQCPHTASTAVLRHPRTCAFPSRSCPLASMACGAEHMVLALHCACVLAWGWNEHGNLGTGDKVSRHEPVLVSLPTLEAGEGAAHGPGRPVGETSITVCAGGAVTYLGRQIA